MRLLTILAVLAVAVSTISAYKISDAETTKKPEMTRAKTMLKQPESLKNFDLGKPTIPRVYKRSEVNKVKGFDVDFKKLNSVKHEEKPVAGLKLEQFQPPKILKNRINTSKKVSLKRKQPENKKFKLDISPNDMNMKENFEIPKYKKNQQLKKYNQDEPNMLEGSFHHDELEHANRKLRGLEAKLEPEEFNSGFDQLESRSGYFNQGKGLVNAGFSRMNSKHLDTPFFGMYGEYDDLEDNVDYLKNRQQRLASMEQRPTDRLMGGETNRMGSSVMSSGFSNLNKLNLANKYGNLDSDFGRLARGRARLGESEGYLKGDNLNRGYAALDDERNHISRGKEVIDGHINNLHHNELSSNYNTLEDTYNDLDDDQSSIIGYGDNLRNFDFQNGFNFMNNEMGNFGGNENGFWDGKNSNEFSGFMRSPVDEWETVY